MNKRANIFDDAAELDLSGFKPHAAPASEPDRAALRQISEASNFPSRQAPKAPPALAQRRRRTGRNVQLNIKATADTVAAFNALCERRNWVAGETLARALAALESKLAGEGPGRD